MFNKLLFHHTPIDELREERTYLTYFSKYKFNQQLNKLTNDLLYLEVEENRHFQFDDLPSSLRELHFVGKHVMHHGSSSLDNLPYNLTHLIFEIFSYFNRTINNLPKKLTHLQLNGYFNQRLDNLPNELTHLTIYGHFNQRLDDLPKKLTHLIIDTIGEKYLYEFPKSLIHIQLHGQEYIKKLNNDNKNYYDAHFEIIGKCSFVPDGFLDNVVSLKSNFVTERLLRRLPKIITHLEFEMTDTNFLFENMCGFPDSLIYLKTSTDEYKRNLDNPEDSNIYEQIKKKMQFH